MGNKYILTVTDAFTKNIPNLWQFQTRKLKQWQMLSLQNGYADMAVLLSFTLMEGGIHQQKGIYQKNCSRIVQKN
jgi:hypothetical protein